MSADIYLNNILNREAVDTSLFSPVRSVQSQVMPAIQEWAGQYLRVVKPSGSFAKGTANKSGTDIDLFISLSDRVTNTMKEIYDTLFEKMKGRGYSPKRQNVSINISLNGYSVDLVPGKRQNAWSEDHSLYRRKADTWTKTNIDTHIAKVTGSGRAPEIRILKLWRDQKGLDFPSFYLEMTAIEALTFASGGISDRVWKSLQYLRDTFPTARVVDPANTNNIISDDLTATDRQKIKSAAQAALGAQDWNQIVK